MGVPVDLHVMGVPADLHVMGVPVDLYLIYFSADLYLVGLLYLYVIHQVSLSHCVVPIIINYYVH